MFAYRPGFIANKILIVGCGGTGSRLVPLIAQFVKTCTWVQDPEIHLVDDDVVEEKNLFRQNFIQRDVGKNKAEVLAERYSKAFGINILPHSQRIVDKEDISEFNWLTAISKNSLVLLCVDSPEARRDIVDLLSVAFGFGTTNSLLIDAGNENDFGQVYISSFLVGRGMSNELKTILDSMTKRKIVDDLFLNAIPLNVDYFHSMKSESKLSCADLDQTMAINASMAITIFGLVQQFYYAKPFYYNRINISLAHGAIPQYIDSKYLIETSKKAPTVSLKNGRRADRPYIDNHRVIEEYYYESHSTFVTSMDELEKDLAKKAKDKEMQDREDWFIKMAVKRGLINNQRAEAVREATKNAAAEAAPKECKIEVVPLTAEEIQSLSDSALRISVAPITAISNVLASTATA